MTDQERLDELLSSTGDLSSRVYALAGQIELVNEFLRTDLDAGATRAFEEASRALAEARDLDAKAVTREELERQERKRAEKEKDARRKRTILITSVSVLLTLIFTVFGVLVGQAHRTTDQLSHVFNTFTVTAFDACQRRNGQTAQLTTAFTQLLEAEKKAPASDARQARISAYETALNNNPPLDDCSIYKRLSLDNTDGK